MQETSPTDLLPIPPGAPMPHRKVLRQWLMPLSRRRTAYPIALLALDLLLWAGLLAAALLLTPWWAKLAAGGLTGLVLGRLFIIGHDACHQSLTPHRRLNKLLGRIAFLPSLTPYSLWDVGHNVVHHGYTNLKGFDFVWQPLTREEFAALPRRSRLLDRVYRSGWAPGLYYLLEIWWKRMFFPSRRQMPTRRALFFWDNVAVSVFGAAWLGACVAIALATGQSVLLTLAAAFVVPLAVWFALIGFVVYVHHTHPEVEWHEERAAWAAAQPFVSTTVHLRFRAGVGTLLHHIMEHTAHHVDMGIPLYRLKRAQAKLEEMLPGHIVVQNFSWRWYFDTARRCKLYDFGRRCWTDYRGRATSVPQTA
jgi:acyl-lipid omega-6 desaturase (Delta-12 desaturase)